MENIGLAELYLPQALENASSIWPLQIKDGVTWADLSAYVKEDVSYVYHFLLEAGIDSYADVEHHGFEPQLELLSMLLRSQCVFQRSDANHEAAECREGTRDLVEITEDDVIMFRGSSAEPVDDAIVRHKLLAEACLYSDLDLASMLLKENGNASIYKRHIHPDVGCNLGIPVAGDVSRKLEMIRLVYSHIDYFPYRCVRRFPCR